MHTRHISGACQAAVSSDAHRMDAGADRCDDSVPLSELLVMLRDLPPQAQTHIHQSRCRSCKPAHTATAGTWAFASHVRQMGQHRHIGWHRARQAEPIQPQLAANTASCRTVASDSGDDVKQQIHHHRLQHQYQHQPTDFTTKNPSRHAHQRTQSWPQVTSGRSRT